jgi:acyl carrier protein
MAGKLELNQLFFNVIDEFNAQADEDKQIEKHTGVTLFGDGGVLDSLGLVNLITLIEEHVEDEYDLTITLADEKAMSRKTSPFRTVGSLIAYVSELLEENQDG